MSNPSASNSRETLSRAFELCLAQAGDLLIVLRSATLTRRRSAIGGVAGARGWLELAQSRQVACPRLQAKIRRSARQLSLTARFLLFSEGDMKGGRYKANRWGLVDIEEFRGELKNQLSLLRDYCDLYDSGKVSHALSIANRLSVIIEMLRGETGGDFVRQTSLRLLSNAPSPHALDIRHGFHPLAPLEVSHIAGSNVTTASFFPVHRTPASIHATKQMKIGAWLKEDVLISTHKHRTSRGDLISQMRNKDGGSHAPSDPTEAYNSVASKVGIGLTAIGPDGHVNFDPPAHFATIRHISYEVSLSIGAVLPQ